MADDPSNEGPSPALIAAMTGAPSGAVPATPSAPTPPDADSSDSPSPALVAAMTGAPHPAPAAHGHTPTAAPHRPTRFQQSVTPPPPPPHGQPPAPEPSWGDVAGQAVHNFLPSLGGDIPPGRFRSGRLTMGRWWR